MLGVEVMELLPPEGVGVAKVVDPIARVMRKAATAMLAPGARGKGPEISPSRRLMMAATPRTQDSRSDFVRLRSRMKEKGSSERKGVRNQTAFWSRPSPFLVDERVLFLRWKRGDLEVDSTLENLAKN